MAPEVFRHELYNHKVDQYSFAMIAYQVGCVWRGGGGVGDGVGGGGGGGGGGATTRQTRQATASTVAGNRLPSSLLRPITPPAPLRAAAV
jgi:hypothetical protein